MKKTDLLNRLSQYDDDDEILVETIDGGFHDPVIYISSVRARNAAEFTIASTSSYVHGDSNTGFGAVILGTSIGFAKLE